MYCSLLPPWLSSVQGCLVLVLLFFIIHPEVENRALNRAPSKSQLHVSSSAGCQGRLGTLLVLWGAQCGAVLP